MGDDSKIIPIIDVSPFIASGNDRSEEKQAVAREWDEAFRTVGFAIIVNHGVSPDLIDRMRTCATEFFEEQTLHQKLMYHRGPYGSPEGGFNAVGQESVNRSRDALGSDGGGGAGDDHGDDGVSATTAPSSSPDLVESFILKPSQVENDPQELAKVGAEYRKEMLRLLTALHELSATALGLDDVNFFTQFYDTTDQHSLRLAYYPACTEPPPPGTLRYGTHTDYTGFTILLQDDKDTSSSMTADGDAGGGLEVKLPNGSFHPVEAVPNAFVVNIGDMFQVWTNDRWKSTVHRVAAPTQYPCTSRLSVPFFSGPNNEAKIVPILLEPDEIPKHETITAGEHLWRKLKATQT